MKLNELVPDLPPEQLAECEIKLGVKWADQKVTMFVIDGSGAIVANRDLQQTSAPITTSQADYWKIHHNPWLD